ncbi:MAG TPA: hypothetical protein VHE37_14320 [Nevskiaceae bacterium]|nr:hypothetical protein [Nevskiaceae bacterium]
MSTAGDPALAAFRPECFHTRRIGGGNDLAQYQRLLEQTYEPLGFMVSAVLPTAASMQYKVTHCGRIVAIFRLTPVDDGDSAYFHLVPGACADGRPRRLLEVNNVVIASPFRATILLGLLLYESAKAAHRLGYDYVVGITRHQALKFFVDFGVVPVDHPPLRLLGKEHLLDFVIYYDTRSPESIGYMHERARRWFHQQYVLRSIHRKYVEPLRAPAAPALAVNA